MIVYHGSPHNFKKLRICKGEHISTEQNEGRGIYFSSIKSVAETYGNYLYTLDVNDYYIKDFRKTVTCEKFLRDLELSVARKTNVWLRTYIDFNTVLSYMVSGGLSIFDLAREIWLLLDSHEYWYTHFSDNQRNLILSSIRQFVKRNLSVYFFPYHIQGVGVIKDVSPLVVNIVSKESNGKGW